MWMASRVDCVPSGGTPIAVRSAFVSAGGSPRARSRVLVWASLSMLSLIAVGRVRTGGDTCGRVATRRRLAAIYCFRLRTLVPLVVILGRGDCLGVGVGASVMCESAVNPGGLSRGP